MADEPLRNESIEVSVERLGRRLKDLRKQLQIVAMEQVCCLIFQLRMVLKSFTVQISVSFLLVDFRSFANQRRSANTFVRKSLFRFG